MFSRRSGMQKKMTSRTVNYNFIDLKYVEKVVGFDW